jgi:hypothetical protein
MAQKVSEIMTPAPVALGAQLLLDGTTGQPVPPDRGAGDPAASPIRSSRSAAQPSSSSSLAATASRSWSTSHAPPSG